MDNKSLITKIGKAANIISNKVQRGSANYIVASQETYDRFNQVFLKYRRKDKIKKILKWIKMRK